MADPWPRETFVIPENAGQVGRTIDMIKIDNTFRTLLLTILNGDTTDQATYVRYFLLHCLKITQEKAKSEHQPVRQEATEGVV